MVVNPAAAMLDAKEALRQRLHTAALTVQCLPSDGPRGVYSVWPAYRHTWWDEGNENSKLSAADITRRLIAAPQFAPTPRQVSDCLPALALLDGGHPIWRRILTLRAHMDWYQAHDIQIEGGWRRIGAACGVSHDRARKGYLRAISHAFERWLMLGTQKAA